jgi:hypothetical protein
VSVKTEADSSVGKQPPTLGSVDRQRPGATRSAAGFGIFAGPLRRRPRKKAPIQFAIKIAVGTALAGGPPHRSVREELLHTAPTLGRTSRRCPAHSPALTATWRVRHGVRAMCTSSDFPSVEPLPLTDSARGGRTRVCSSASSVLRVRLTSPRRACRPCRHQRSPTVPTPKSWKPMGSPGSRA